LGNTSQLDMEQRQSALIWKLPTFHEPAGKLRAIVLALCFDD